MSIGGVRHIVGDTIVCYSGEPVKRRRPDAFLAVMGCFVSDIPTLQKAYPYVDAFLPPSDVDGFLEAVRYYFGLDGTKVKPPPPAPVAAYVPIIHGCDHFCTYCIVRLRRGRERSRPIPEVVAEVEELVKRGAREVTLLGQNVDAYGRDLPGQPDLADLLEAIHPIEGLWRIRFLTSHPGDMKQRIIEAVARLPKVCEHIEIPVQSGDDTILKRMVRGYTVAQYKDLVRRIRETIPGVSIATDVIVGFPGETEEQFMNTYRLKTARLYWPMYITFCGRQVSLLSVCRPNCYHQASYIIATLIEVNLSRN